MKKILCILMAVFMLFAISGCGQKDGLEEITLVLDWTPNTNHAGIFLARDLGYYSDAGLKVNIIQPPEGGAEALVAAGRAQFGISFQDSMAPALSASEPLDIVAVAAISQHNLSGIISRGDKNIYSFKDLEGKSYATWGSPIEQTVIKYCMEQEGGDFSSLNMIDSTVTDVLAALETDMVDTVWVYEYWDVVKADIENYEYCYIDFKSVDEVLDYYTPVIITSNKYAEENSDVVKRFLTATKRGYEECAKDIEKAADSLLKADESLDRELVVRSLSLLQSYFIDDNGNWGYIDSDRWNLFYNWLYDNGLVDKSLENVGFNGEYLR
ncbi:MAG: ABC transporter substrate-binding protein [Clostridia bacterium]|nr:ABC transporter substrate-binding protein [Clostridia bacterium]